MNIRCCLQALLEVLAAWDCMQKELQRLVTELLGTSASASHSASGNRTVRLNDDRMQHAPFTQTRSASSGHSKVPRCAIRGMQISS